MELGLGFCVDGGPRLPWSFARALVLVGLCHGSIMLCRLPVGENHTMETSRPGLPDKVSAEFATNESRTSQNARTPHGSEVRGLSMPISRKNHLSSWQILPRRILYLMCTTVQTERPEVLKHVLQQQRGLKPSQHSTRQE